MGLRALPAQPHLILEVGPRPEETEAGAQCPAQGHIQLSCPQVRSCMTHETASQGKEEHVAIPAQAISTPRKKKNHAYTAEGWISQVVARSFGGQASAPPKPASPPAGSTSEAPGLDPALPQDSHSPWASPSTRCCFCPLLASPWLQNKVLWAIITAAPRRPRQEDHTFKASTGNSVSSRLGVQLSGRALVSHARGPASIRHWGVGGGSVLSCLHLLQHTVGFDLRGRKGERTGRRGGRRESTEPRSGSTGSSTHGT